MNGSQERLSARPTIGTCQVILQCNMPALFRCFISKLWMHISLFLFNGASAAAAGPPSWSFPAWRNSRLLEADWKAFLRQSGLLDPFAAKDAQTGGALCQEIGQMVTLR